EPLSGRENLARGTRTGLPGRTRKSAGSTPRGRQARSETRRVVGRLRVLVDRVGRSQGSARAAGSWSVQLPRILWIEKHLPANDRSARQSFDIRRRRGPRTARSESGEASNQRIGS